MYQKAKCIELHEAHTIITTDNEMYACSAPTGRGEHSDRPAMRIQLADLVPLIEMITGVDANKHVHEPYSAKRRNVDELDLPIYRTYYETPQDEPQEQILSLECEVLGPQLVNIMVVSRLKGMREDDPDIKQKITHCGTFTIWWDDTAEENASK